MSKKITFRAVMTASVWFPKTARGHAHRGSQCVCRDCGMKNPHEAHVPSKATPFHLSLEGSEANAFLHMEGNR